MKMRSKRDQRPLLTQEAPILSDQIDPSTADATEEEEETDFLESQNHLSQQAKGQKKRPWRRLFGKNNNNIKRKENQNPQATEGSSLPSFSQSSSSDSGDDSTQKQERQAKIQLEEPQQQLQRHGLSPRMQSDKRDDGTESSQNTSHHLKDILDHDDAGMPSPIDYYKAGKGNSKKSFSGMSSPSTNTMTSPAGISTATQQHRNHISPRQTTPSNIGPSSTRSATSRSTSRRTASSRAVSLVHQVRHKRSASSFSAATAATNKILSRPFGREHILTTQETVCFANS
jgi:hypothetical protein